MAEFVQKYLLPRRAEALVLDRGSQGFNGSYRSFFDQAQWRNLGVGIAAGPNVDIVLREPCRWQDIKAESADIVISGQTFEHTEYFGLSLREIARALKVGALLCLIAGLGTIEAWTQWENRPQYDNESNKGPASVLAARNPPEKARPRWRRGFERWFVR